MRRALIWSAVWVAMCVATAVAVMVFLVTRRIGGPMTPERSAQFGTAAGIVAGIGLVPIWWFYYYDPREKARRAAEKESKKGKKRLKSKK